MSFDRILCLANSYKHDNRCVAGIDYVTNRWVRLIGNEVPGCLTRNETCYQDGEEAAVLDVFEAELGEPCGSRCHPEDIHITTKPWRLLRRFDASRDSALIEPFVNRKHEVLHGHGDRIYARKVENWPVNKSLELIQPNDLWWWIRVESDKRKNRALFRFGHVSRVQYNLPVTDPIWLDRLHSMPPGIYPHTLFIPSKSTRTLLAVSLSEPFEGFHYKLIAGVINLPA